MSLDLCPLDEFSPNKRRDQHFLVLKVVPIHPIHTKNSCRQLQPYHSLFMVSAQISLA